MRKDNSKGYNPDNCYWSLDDPRNGQIYNWEGIDYNIGELANHFGLNKKRIQDRIKSGFSLEESVLAPEWTPGWTGRKERDAYIEANGEFKQKGAICPFVFTEYPDISFNDPKLTNCNISSDI